MDQSSEKLGLGRRRIDWYFSSPGHKLSSPSRLREEIKNLKEKALRDSLTGIYNRRGLEELCDKYVEIWKRVKTSLYIFVIDIDNFKQVNDTLGHEAGDNLLKKVAMNLQGSLRKGDIVAISDNTEHSDEVGYTDNSEALIGRMGGDEFIVIAFSKKPEELTKRIKDSFDFLKASLDIRSDLKESLGFSIGYAALGEGFEDSTDVSRLSSDNLFLKAKEIADKRMYEEKRGKKNEGR